MRDEFAGIYYDMELASPEAFKAQRQAELKNLSEYRSRHIQKIIDWSDPVKRAEIQKVYLTNETCDRELLKNIHAKYIAVRSGYTPTLGAVPWKYQELPKPNWWQRLRKWITKRFK